MNVLIIGQDRTLLLDEKEAPSNTRERMLLISEGLSKLCIALLVIKGEKERKIEHSDKVYIYTVPFHGRPPSFWRGYKICSRICLENKIDVISTQDVFYTGLVGYLLKKRLNIPLNVQLHGNYLDNDFWLKSSKTFRFVNTLGKLIVKKADSVRAVSSIIKNTLINKIGIPEWRIIKFPVFTDINRFGNISEENINLKEKYKNYENIILFVGTLTKRKNVEALLWAAKEIIKSLPKTLFLIVGEGPEKTQLVKVTIKLEIEQNVYFAGEVAYEELPHYYQACDLFILPSKEDGWGRVVIEALAAGKPVIVSEACGVSDVVIDAKSGFIFPINRSDILAEKIIYLFENPEIRAEMGERGRRYVKENLDMKKNAYRYRELHEKTIELAKQG